MEHLPRNTTTTWSTGKTALTRIIPPQVDLSMDRSSSRSSHNTSIEDEGVNLADEDRLVGSLPSFEDNVLVEDQQDEDDYVEDDDDDYVSRKSSSTALSPIQEGPGLEA